MKSDLFFENLRLSLFIGFVSLTFNILFAFILVYFNLDVAKNPVFNQKNLLGYFFVLVFVGPLVEELMFRLPIIPSKLFCMISIGVIFLVLIKIFFKDNLNKGYILLLIWAFLILIYNYLSNIMQFDSKYSLFIFSIISSLFFAYAHIYNFKLNTNESSLLTLFPIFVMGLLLTYIRLKAGIGWSIFTHSLSNFFPMGLGILLKYFKLI